MNRIALFITLAFASAMVSAAVPTEVTTQIATTTADVTTIGGAFLILAIVVAGFVWMRRGAR